MEYHLIPHSLPGHPDCKTIRIIYSIPPGIQGPEHPNPGKSFSARGFPRHCYLPDSEKGRKVLKLLLVAWDRRLIFAIGTSSTTGESDTVIWNEVHHKTEFGSNLTGHGYPDANYLDVQTWGALKAPPPFMYESYKSGIPSGPVLEEPQKGCQPVDDASQFKNKSVLWGRAGINYIQSTSLNS